MAEEFLTASGQPQLTPAGAASSGDGRVKITGADQTAQFLSPKTANIRGITRDIIGPAANQQLQIGLPLGPSGGLAANGVPLVWSDDGLGSGEWVPAQPPTLFAFIQVTEILPNSLDLAGEVALRSAAGYIGMNLSDPILTIFAPDGADANISCAGDGTSTLIAATNTAVNQFVLFEATLSGESNDSPSLALYGGVPVVQPTVGGSTTTDLADLQQVVRNLLDALSTDGSGVSLLINGTV